MALAFDSSVFHSSIRGFLYVTEQSTDGLCRDPSFSVQNFPSYCRKDLYALPTESTTGKDNGE